jgi:hypothetical protein
MSIPVIIGLDGLLGGCLQLYALLCLTVLV